MQRVEDEHAELPVAGPGLALAEPLEGADVDEHRLGAAPLDVVGRRVLEHEPLVERAEEEVELEQRRVLEHPERPLVRVRDDRDALVPEDAPRRSRRRKLVRQVVELGHALGGHERAVGDLLREERRSPRAPPSRRGHARRARAGRRRLRRRRGCPGRGRSRARPGARRPLRVVLLPDAEESEEPAPVELARHRDRGHAADDRPGGSSTRSRDRDMRERRPCVGVENTPWGGAGAGATPLPAATDRACCVSGV